MTHTTAKMPKNINANIENSIAHSLSLFVVSIKKLAKPSIA
jgi:hypothetical protein